MNISSESLQMTSNRSHSWRQYEKMYRDESLTDVVINCIDGQIKAHKLVLSAWSQYFEDIFVNNNQLCQISYIFMKDIPFNDLKILIELMYCGFASLTKHQLVSIERTAKALGIKDLNQLLIQSNDKKNYTNDRNCYESRDYNQRKRKRKIDYERDNKLSSHPNQDIQEVISFGNSFNNNNQNNNSFNSNNFFEQSILKQISNAINETKSTDNQMNVFEKMNRELEEKSETQTQRSMNSILEKRTQSVGKSSSHDNNNNEKTFSKTDGRDFYCNKTLDLIRNSLNKNSTQTENSTSRDLENTVVRCLRSSIQQSPRFEQLPYQERQHHFKLQQMRYQSLNETQSNSDDERISSDSDQTSDSEKLLIQLNPSDVLCDSEESDCDLGTKETKEDPKAMIGSRVEPIKRQTTTANISNTPTKGDELHLHLSPPALTRRGLSETETNSTPESLLVYNLAANPMPVRPTPTSKSSAIMYISDPKVGQIIVSNVKESEKEIVPKWSSSGRKHTNIAPKLSPQSTAVKVTRNSISSSNSITLLNSDTSHQKKTIAAPQTQRTATKSTSNRKKRNNYQCNECTKAYSSQQTLTDHYKIVHQNSTENYACKVCGKAVKWKDSLRSHFKTNHPDIDSTDMIEIL